MALDNAYLVVRYPFPVGIVQPAREVDHCIYRTNDQEFILNLKD
jgi:hypothetical protein